MAARGRTTSCALRAAAVSLATAVALSVAPGAASAQEMGHDVGGLAAGQVAAGIVNGVAQGIMLFLVGLVAFAAVVWIPVSRQYGGIGAPGRLFARGTWVLAGALVVVGVVDLSVYAVRATGDSLGPGLFGEALFGTRTGWIWASRILLGGLTALAATWAARGRRSAPWWAATGIGSALLVTLAQGSHAAAEPGMLPFVSSWLHVVAAALWLGGLAGLPAIMLGPLRALEPEERSELRREAVPASPGRRPRPSLSSS